MTKSKREKRTKYAKIPRKHKILFLKKVLQLNQPLKQTADLFKINYSTAKTLIRQYRNEILDIDLSDCQNYDDNSIHNTNDNLRRCNFKQLLFEGEKPSETTIMGFQGEETQKKPIKPDQQISSQLKIQKLYTPKQIAIISRIQFA